MGDLSRCPDQQRARGSVLEARAHHAVLITVCELPERDGFASITVEATAERTKGGRPTTYRWWPNKVAVVTDSFLELTAPEILFDPKGPMWHGFIKPARIASLEYYW